MKLRENCTRSAQYGEFYYRNTANYFFVDIYQSLLFSKVVFNNTTIDNVKSEPLATGEAAVILSKVLNAAEDCIDVLDIL